MFFLSCACDGGQLNSGPIDEDFPADDIEQEVEINNEEVAEEAGK